MKKIMLCHPEISRGKYNFAGVIENEPLELEYIARVIRDRGGQVRIWDGQVEKTSLEKALADFAPDYFYVCGRTRQEDFMKEYCRLAKERGCVTIAGGVHVQGCTERFREPYIDFLAVSFDVFSIAEIMEGTSPEKIEGIVYRTKDGYASTPAPPFDINRLPLPDREYFYSHKDNYRYLELSPCAHVRTSCCCPYRCSFCYRNSLNKGVYSARNIEAVVAEIEKTDCGNIYFIDDDFLYDRSRIARFISLVKERGLRKKYVCYGRADFIAANPDLINQLGEIGFYYILTGLEAADNKHLSMYNKKITADVNLKAVKITKSAGIRLMGMFIVDLDFTPGDFAALYRYICRNDIRHTAISIFTPEMSGGLMEKYKDRLVTSDPACWDYLHVVAKPEKMSVGMYYFFYHILVAMLFLRGRRQGIYDFIDYGFYLKSIFRNMFRFGGNREGDQ